MLSLVQPLQMDISEIVPQMLFMSGYMSAEDLPTLQSRSITHIVTVSGGIKPKYPHLFEYLVLPIDDQSDQNLKQYFLKAVEFIDEALYGQKHNKPTAVLVHCAAGISRSGGIVCAYLMWKQRWSFDVAWKYGRSKRSVMFPNMGFQSQLKMFQAEMGIGSDQKRMR